MIKYLGSKRLLLPGILDAISSLTAQLGQTPATTTVLDLFSGTSRVGHALKSAGYRVLANDHNAYAHTLATTYVQADADDHAETAQQLITELNALPPRPGFITETYCLRSRYFHPSNGQRIDAIRDAIAAKSLPPELEAILLTSLMEAADRVDSTTGLQMAYLKQWAPRAHNPLALRLPALLPHPPGGKCTAHMLDALAAAETLSADIVYLDPPYNQHSYLGNYHIWETLVRWDTPQVYGIACKRIDCRTRRSPFNRRGDCEAAFRAVLQSLRCKAIVVSFSNEGYLTRETLEALLADFAATPGQPPTPLGPTETPYKRYVGARIGIYNPQGEKVGKISHLENKEYLYAVLKGTGPRLRAEAP